MKDLLFKIIFGILFWSYTLFFLMSLGILYIIDFNTLRLLSIIIIPLLYIGFLKLLDFLVKKSILTERKLLIVMLSFFGIVFICLFPYLKTAFSLGR